MEKVVLLVEHSGEHLRCLLNPEQLEVHRSAGVVARHSRSGAMTGIGLSDDPVLYRGGGSTELILDLLFDLGLAEQGPDMPAPDDVRKLTRPIWDLAENHAGQSRYGRPPTMRLLWGATWNLRGLVTAVSERLEQFDSQGRAGRSWLRLRVRRVDYPRRRETDDPSEPPIAMDEARQRMDATATTAHEPVGGNRGERMDQIASERLGHPGLWSLIAEQNGLADPLKPAGKPLQVPSKPIVSSGGEGA